MIDILRYMDDQHIVMMVNSELSLVSRFKSKKMSRIVTHVSSSSLNNLSVKYIINRLQDNPVHIYLLACELQCSNARRIMHELFPHIHHVHV